MNLSKKLKLGTFVCVNKQKQNVFYKQNSCWRLGKKRTLWRKPVKQLKWGVSLSGPLLLQCQEPYFWNKCWISSPLAAPAALLFLSRRKNLPTLYQLHILLTTIRRKYPKNALRCFLRNAMVNSFQILMASCIQNWAMRCRTNYAWALTISWSTEILTT